jgi:hypothetical protein
VEDWLVNGGRKQLFIASGSTKTSEFPTSLLWLNTLIQTPPEQRTVGGRRVISVTPGPIDDELADAAVQEVDPQVPVHVKRNFGTRFDFVIAAATDAPSVSKSIFLLNNTMPINFMFYGTPVEILDYSLAQLLDVTALLARRAPGLSAAQVYATDYSLNATQGVWMANTIDRDFVVPKPAGIPLPDAG